MTRFARMGGVLTLSEMTMSNSYDDKPEDFAARALELLEQAYAYYQPPLQTVAKAQAKEGNETYYEYVKAA
ncbi:hypothetical protein NNA36_01195 [Shimia sp. CNT1-13L.2]|uniref:hypothetical protein n=1 Tax=Shimia sp. CNT1-13L.2 TaxID=2959663 RepID=UPI0020CE01C7|nr:hypothetical protein [Shimia sp. CNT1-13L.2]MCP9480566.1 hypothetical protein [Shimia sp. CNT1-13L.2]